MSQNLITAAHIEMGIWEFKCMAHEPPCIFRNEAGNPEHATGVMQAHCDGAHKGQLMNLSRESQYSGSWRGHYTAPAERMD
jgi:hypothetical protein